MNKKTKDQRIGKTQQKVLDILEKYGELTARDIAEIIWARDIRYKTAEYSSVHRSLRSLHARGLVEKSGGQVKWRKTKKSR
jgi:DNA-binding MarR family transcriptional regulator